MDLLIEPLQVNLQQKRLQKPNAQNLEAVQKLHKQIIVLRVAVEIKVQKLL
jgi:hypothetical protein